MTQDKGGGPSSRAGKPGGGDRRDGRPGGGGPGGNRGGPRKGGFGKGGFGKGPGKPARVETYESVKEIMRGADFRIDKFVVAEKGSHRPVKTEYRLTREGLAGPVTYGRLVEAQTAATEPLPEPEAASAETTAETVSEETVAEEATSEEAAPAEEEASAAPAETEQ